MRLLLLLLLCTVLAKAQNTLTPDQPAPALSVSEWLLNTPDTTLLKRQPVVLEFWATWCGPCIAAVPHLNELQETYASRGVQFVSLTDEPPAKVRATLARIKFLSAVGTDESSATQARFGDGEALRTYPMTVLIDAKGLVKWVGEPKRLTAKVMDAFLAGTLTAKNTLFTLGTDANPSPAIELEDQRFRKDSRNAGELYQLRFGLSTLSPEKGSSSIDDEHRFDYRGSTLANLFLSVFDKEINVTDSLAELSYDLTYINRRPAPTALADLEAQLLDILGMRLSPKLVSRTFLEVSVSDTSKLPPRSVGFFGSVSDADGQLIIEGLPLKAALNAYAERNSIKPIFVGTDSQAYDLILSTRSEAALLKDLASYGLSAKPVVRAVTVYELVQ